MGHGDPPEPGAQEATDLVGKKRQSKRPDNRLRQG